MKVAIIFIGTAKYKSFFNGYYKGLVENFLKTCRKEIFVFTDDPCDPVFAKPNVTINSISHEEWPYITLHRFKFIRTVESQLRNYDHVFFVDADLWCVSEVNIAEIVGKFSLVGVQHPGFIGKIGEFETDTRSHASIFDGHYDLEKYRQGCLWGGRSDAVIEMVRELDRKIDDDKTRGIVAVWHDESHINKYFLINASEVHTLHPGFAQPQYGYENIIKEFPTKFVHLHKDGVEFQRFEGIR